MNGYPEIIRFLFNNGKTSLSNTDMTIERQIEIITNEINKKSEVFYVLMAFASLIKMSQSKERDIIKNAQTFFFNFYKIQMPQILSLIRFNYIPSVLKRVEEMEGFLDTVNSIINVTENKDSFISALAKHMKEDK